MGKKDGKEKNSSPRETEEEKVVRQLRKPLKKAVNLFGPEGATEKVQALVISLVQERELKAAKAKIEKEAKSAKKAIDKEAKKALAALAHDQASRPEPEQKEASPSPVPASATPDEPAAAPQPEENASPAAALSMENASSGQRPAAPAGQRKASRAKAVPAPPSQESHP